MTDVIGSQGLEAAQVIMTEGVAQAVKQGKRRPTALLLTSIAKELSTPSIPAQEQRSEISVLPAQPSVPVQVTALERVAASLKERVYSLLAPAAVQAALEADPVAAREHLERLGGELERVSKRLAAARRAVVSAAQATEAASS
ncbi:hypothetical protein [Streptomyces sp. NPDC048737]|uniref:hypothetical protein n=1 Tax=unclassified Streptomyces TaxID=2593676 RepID=UPI00343E74A7